MATLLMGHGMPRTHRTKPPSESVFFHAVVSLLQIFTNVLSVTKVQGLGLGKRLHFSTHGNGMTYNTR